MLEPSTYSASNTSQDFVWGNLGRFMSVIYLACGNIDPRTYRELVREYRRAEADDPFL